MAEEQQGRVIVQRDGRRIDIPQGRELVHADQLEIMLEAMLESIEGRYTPKQETVNAVNAIMRIHLTKHHTPWWRRLIAWGLEPLFAQRALAQQDSTRAPIPDAIEVDEPEGTPFDASEDLDAAASAVVARAQSIRHTAAEDGLGECKRCGDFHLVDELEEINAAIAAQWDRPEARDTFHQEEPAAAPIQVLESGVKFRDKRGTR